MLKDHASEDKILLVMDSYEFDDFLSHHDKLASQVKKIIDAFGCWKGLC
jgi:hypothetical protein